MLVNYVSVWDGGTEISTTANYNQQTGLVDNIMTTDEDVEDLDILDREYIQTDDFSEKIRVLDFDTFKELWLEQECDSVEDVEQFKEEIEESLDFDDLFKVIGLWSHTPTTLRVGEFLKRNTACYRED